METWSKEQLEQGASLTAIFEKKDDEGNYVYSDDDMRAFLPFLILSTGLNVASSPQLTKVMAEFCVAAGFDGTMSVEQQQAAIDKFFEKHPINVDLLADYQRFCNQLAVKGAAVTPALNKYLTDGPRAATQRAARPAGAMSALAARSSNQKPKK
jgi:hypothetical protein